MREMMEILTLQDQKTGKRTLLTPLDTAIAPSTGVEMRYERGEWYCFGKNRLNRLSTKSVYTWDECDWVVHRGNISLEDLL